MAAHANQPNGHHAPRNGQRPAEPRTSRRTLPHNTQAEASILGGIIVSNEVLRGLATLETGDFYDHKHKVVFEAMRNLEARAVPIDVTTLEVEIERVGKLDAVGGAAFLGVLALKVPTVDNVLAYAKTVRDHSLLRKTILLADDIATRGLTWEDEPDELLGELVVKGQEIDRGYREADERIPFISVDGSFDQIEQLSRTPIFETPFEALNASIGFGGLLAGSVYYLAGGTGFGKTSFVGRIVRHHAERDGQALIAFWEMFAGYYTARMTAGLLGVHANQILRNRVDRDRVVGALPKDRIQYLDSPSLGTLERAVDYVTRTTGRAPLLVVDYIQLLADVVMVSMSRPDPRIATSMASASLRMIAKKTGAAILCVTGASRSSSRKLAADVRKLPARDLIDASKESGSIEFDGAGVIVLSVSDEKDANDRQIATISIAKARYGETTHIDARYTGATGEWEALERVARITKAVTPPDDGGLRTAIVEVLKQHGPLSGTKIAKFAEKNKSAVLSELDAMIKQGAAAYIGRSFGLPQHAPLDPALAAQIRMAEAASTEPDGPVPEVEA